MAKIITAAQAAELIKSGDSLMVGGFIMAGTPLTLVDAICDKGLDGFTLITNDAGLPGKGTGRLICEKRVKHMIASHIGTNKEAGAQMNAGEMKIDLVPQGTLAERIRAGGAGLGGFLTPTGVGTQAEEGKQKISRNGMEYLLEEPLRAKVALIRAHVADKAGNLIYRGATRNFNVPMATAADIVIAEVSEIVDIGRMDPDVVVTPGIFVDYLVQR